MIIATAPLSLVLTSLETKPTTLLKRKLDGPLPPSPDIIYLACPIQHSHYTHGLFKSQPPHASAIRSLQSVHGQFCQDLPSCQQLEVLSTKFHPL